MPLGGASLVRIAHPENIETGVRNDGKNEPNESRTRSSIEHCHQGLRGRLGGRGVLPCDQEAVDDDVRLPVGHLGIPTALLCEHVFHQEGNDLGQSGRLLLGIGKAGDRSVLHHGIPAAVLAWRRAAGAWHTAATGFPAASIASIRRIEDASSAKSHSGPWPPG
jgi:hypothetical protein